MNKAICFLESSPKAPYNAMDPQTWRDPEGRQAHPDELGPTTPVSELNPGDAVFDVGPSVWRGIVEIRVWDQGHRPYLAASPIPYKTHQLVFEDGGSVFLPVDFRLFCSTTGLRGWSSGNAATIAMCWGIA